MKNALFACLLFLTIADCAAQSERSLVRDGNRAYNDTKYADAEVNYRKALEKNKESQTGVFNLGDALYKQGRYAEAAQEYATTASHASDKDIKAKAYHNLGNSLLKAQKYPESISAYKEALKTNPEDLDTKYNYEFAKAMMQQQQQQQKQQKNDKQDKDKQKQQNQQNQQNQKNQDQQNKDQQNKQDQQQNQDQQKNQQDKTQTAQAKKQQISKEDAERILQAFNNQEKDIQKKLHKKVPVRAKIDKDW